MAQKIARKLTTILAADVAGYTRLMRADEEATLKTLGAYRDYLDSLIEGHGGRVFSTGGDSILAEFGSAVEAVRCAVAWQQDILRRNAALPDDRKLVFRIGINIGDVMVKSGDLFGDGVNVAARLEGLCEPGGLWVSGAVFDQVKHKLPLGFEDRGAQQVKNIAEPVSAYRLLPDQDPAGAGSAAVRKAAGKRPWLIPAAVAALVLVVALGGLAVWQPWRPAVAPASVERMAFPLPDQPSIAVLPFTSLSDDPGQAYFADGITEDLITDLSKVSELFVIARNTMFTFKGQAVKVGRIAEELGVRYVLEGSVRRAGDQVRINAQLIDATTGGHVWAERYDAAMTDVFALQDQVTRQIVAALSLKLTAAAGARQAAAQTVDPQAYDAFLKGWEHYRLDTPAHYARALQYFEEATALDPGYDRAWAAMASIYWKSYKQDWAAVLGLGAYEARRRGLELLAKVAGKPLALAHQVDSQTALWRGQFEAAIEAAELAVTYDSSDADNQVVLAEALIYGGAPDKALALIETARRHDPSNEARYAFLQGLAAFVTEDFAAAAVSFRRTLELNPELWNPEARLGNAYCQPCVVLIATYGHLGRTDEARVLIERIKNEWAGFSISTEYFLWPFKPDTDMERFIEGLRSAGVVE